MTCDYKDAILTSEKELRNAKGLFLKMEVNCMTMTKEQLREALRVEQFPLSYKYDPEWMCENEMGPSSIWLTEFLTQNIELKPEMHVLDMGCGRAMSLQRQHKVMV